MTNDRRKLLLPLLVIVSCRATPSSAGLGRNKATRTADAFAALSTTTTRNRLPSFTTDPTELDSYYVREDTRASPGTTTFRREGFGEESFNDLPRQQDLSRAAPLVPYDGANNNQDRRQQQHYYRSNSYNNNFQQSAYPRTTIQGDSRETWSYYDPYYGGQDRSVEWTMQTDGRPLHANFEVWDGPNNTPQSVKFYSEDGYARPWRATFQSPSRGYTHSIRNSGSLEFPLSASSSSTTYVGGNGYYASSSPTNNQYITGMSTSYLPRVTVQGGSLKTFPISDPNIRSVEVSLQTDGLPMKATVEIWQGPDSVKQIAEVYADNGNARPFRAVVDTLGGHGSTTIAIRNTATIEYPLTATVEPLGY